MTKGVITFSNGERFVDYVTTLAKKLRLFKEDGCVPILEEKTGKEVGRFMCVYGNRFAVTLLSRISDYRGKDTHQVSIEY